MLLGSIGENQSQGNVGKREEATERLGLESVSVKHPAVAREASHLVQNPLPPLKDSGRRVLPPSYLCPGPGTGAGFQDGGCKASERACRPLVAMAVLQRRGRKVRGSAPKSHKSQLMKHFGAPPRCQAPS